MNQTNNALPKNRLVHGWPALAFLVSAALFSASVQAGMEVRVPKDTALAAVVDLDAVRASATCLTNWVGGAIMFRDEQGDLSLETATNLLASYSAGHSVFLAELPKTGVKPDAIHGLTFAAKWDEIPLPRQNAVTNISWGVALAVDRCDLDRLSGYVKGRGLEWRADTVFGVPYYQVGWTFDEMEIPMRLPVVPGADKFLFCGFNAENLWEVYQISAEADKRYASLNQLEDGEIFRCVIPDMKTIPNRQRELFSLVAPSAERVVKADVSLFVREKKVSAKLRLVYDDEASAEAFRNAVPLGRASVNGQVAVLELDDYDSRKALSYFLAGLESVASLGTLRH